MSNKLQLTKKSNGNATKGIMFIIPNKASDKNTWWAGGKDSALSSFDEELRKDENERFVQIWCYSEGDDQSNWQCHTEDHFKDFAFNGLKAGIFSVYLPKSWLANKKENDTLSIDVLDESGEKVLAQYELLCKQQNSRYERFGTFEEVLSRVTA